MVLNDLEKRRKFNKVMLGILAFLTVILLVVFFVKVIPLRNDLKNTETRLQQKEKELDQMESVIEKTSQLEEEVKNRKDTFEKMRKDLLSNEDFPHFLKTLEVEAERRDLVLQQITTGKLQTLGNDDGQALLNSFATKSFNLLLHGDREQIQNYIREIKDTFASVRINDLSLRKNEDDGFTAAVNGTLILAVSIPEEEEESSE